MSITIAPGSTSVGITIDLIDPTTNGPATGLDHTSALDLTVVRNTSGTTSASKTDLSAAGSLSAYTVNSIIEIDATNAKGAYQIDPPDTAFAINAPGVTLYVNDSSGVLIGWLDVDLTAISETARAALEDQYDGTGLTGDEYPARQDQVGNVYYVRKSGNDSNDGSDASPWLTIDHAYETVSSGDTIKIGDGTYDEESAGTGSPGYFLIDRTFTETVTLESENGNRETVLVKGSNANANTWIRTGATNTTFKNLTFTYGLDSSQTACRLLEGVDITFIGCEFQVPPNGGVDGLSVQGAGPITRPTCIDCVATSTSAVSTTGFTFWASSGTITDAEVTRCTTTGSWRGFDVSDVDGIKLTDCVAEGVESGIKIRYNVTDLEIIGGRYIGATYGIVCGLDAVTSTGTVGGKITGAYSEATTGHGFLIGAGANDVVADGCTAFGGDHGVVIKQNDGVVFKNSTAYGGTASATEGAAVFCKAATNSSVVNNTIIGRRGIRGTVRVGAGSSGDPCGDLTITDNHIIVRGGIKAFLWGGSSDDDGGSVCDRNTYDISTGGTIGDVVDTTGITTLAGLQAAWDDYDVTTNDDNSFVSTLIARTGADGDTLEDISDEIATHDGKLDTVDSNVDSILLDTGTTGVTLAADSVNGNSIADNAITAAKIYTGAFTADAFAADALVAATFATDSISADALKADAVAEIQSGLATAAALTTHDGKLDTVDGIVDSILEDTGTTIPATLTSMAGATFNTATDSQEAIRNRGDAAWITGGGGAAPTVEEIRAEMDSNSTQLADIVEDTGTTLPATLTTIDTVVDAIKVKTDLLGSASVTVSSPVASNGDLTLTQHDDYDNDDGRSLEWTNSDGDWAGGDISGASVELAIRHRNGTTVFDVDGAVIDATGTQKVRVELTNETTAYLIHGGDRWTYQLRLTLTSGNQITIDTGRVSATASYFDE